jgi:hypothetical protein
MSIIKIIKETLLLEVGEANVDPFIWKLANKTDDFYIYEFKTAGGSNVTINVTFYRLSPKMMANLVDRDRRLPDDAINLVKKNPKGYWDVEFAVEEDRGSAIDNPYITISKSEFKSDKIELFKILSTLNKIVNDFLNKQKDVRGLTFKPVTKKRGTVFLTYFKKLLPDTQKMVTHHGVHIIVLDKNLGKVDTRLKKQSYLDRKSFGDEEY